MSSPFLEVKKFLIGKIEEQAIPSISSGVAVIPLKLPITSPLSKGTGLTVDITAVAGIITVAAPNIGGTGYAVGDTVLVEGGVNGALVVATAPLGVVGSLTINNGGTGYTTGTAQLTDPMPSWATKFPEEFVIQDMANRERLLFTGIEATAGVYSAVASTNLVNSYAVPFASILTPGAVQILTSEDFNVRLRALTMAPTIVTDGEAEKFATGDHRKDFSIMGMRTGTIGFQDKVAVNLFPGTGLTLDITAVAGAITVAVIHTAGTGYNVGDLVTVAGGVDGVVKIKTVNVNTGAVTAIDIIANAGSGYTTTTNEATTIIHQLPTWGKFAVGMGMLPKKYTTTGMGLVGGLNAADDITMTLGVCFVQGGGNPAGQMFLFSGCKGDGDISADGLGKPWVLKGNFTGKFLSETDLTNSQIYQLTTPETALPEKMLSNLVNTTPVGSANAVPLRVTKFSLAFGNKVGQVPNQEDPTGIAYFMITERDPKVSIDPLLKPVREEDIFNNVNNEQSVGIIVQSALIAPKMTLEAPRSQLMYPTIGNKDGIVDTTRTYRCLGNDLGSGSAQPLMTFESSYEILIGTRS
jgi:hypothetical protein